MDISGRFTYSAIAKIAFKMEDAALTVYPNPASNTINIKYTGNQKKITLTVFDVAAQQVMFKELNNQNILQANISGLAKGIYTVKINNGAKQSYVKLIKQ